MMRRSGSAGVCAFLSFGFSVFLCVKAATNVTIAGSCVKEAPASWAGRTVRCAERHCSLAPITNEICTAATLNTSCSGHGRCSTAVCACDPGWEGERCADVTPQVLSAGHALAFDGSDDFLFAELDENLLLNGAMDNFTLMAWIKPVYKDATGLDMHIVGHAAEDGPYLGLTKGVDGERRLKVFTFWSRWEADHCTSTAKFNETVIRGENWHHVAVTADRNELSTYVDGVLQSHCAFNYTKANWTSVSPGRTVHVGRGDAQLDSANHRQYKGEIDEVRYFRRHMTKPQIDSMRSRALAAGERAELILHLSFDEDDSVRFPNGCSQAGLPPLGRGSTAQVSYAGGGYGMSSVNVVPTRSVKDQSPARHNVVLGGTSCIPPLLSRAPRAVPSSAPLADHVLQREIREREDTEVQLLAVSHSDKRAQILSVPSCGTLRATNGTVLNTGALPITLDDDTFVFAPPENAAGEVFELVATLLSGTQPLPHNITVRILVRPKNRAPIAGSAGGAIECDGIRTYMYNQDFQWPVQNFSHGRGGSAVTVEWWGYVPDDSAGDRAVFSIGNDEVAKGWVNEFNPYKKGGRFFARAPGPKGELSLDVGTYSTTSGDMTPFYNDWAHFAVTHDQTEGQHMAIYINGIELARGTHDFVGVGQIIESVQFEVPEKTEIQSLMLCSWSFWSEVYHKGMIDEFRIWNASKTIDEIRDNMHKPLNGDEPNLVAYYNFDDDPSIDVAVDKTGSSTRPRYDLHAGGCATCDEDGDRFKGYMPDTNSLVCQPSAKSADSEYFIDDRVYGASSHCFGEGRERENTKPRRVPSGARLGGYIDAQTVNQGETGDAGLPGDGDTLVVLNGTDPDENDHEQIHFIITELPSSGKGTLFHVNTTDSKPTAPVRVNDPLVYSNRKVFYRPPKGQNGEQKGGLNFAAFKYKVSDGLLESENEAVVHFNLYCPAGRFLSESDSLCKECVPGRYAPQANVGKECQLCGRNEYQDKPGQKTCVGCLSQRYCSEGGCANCNACNVTIDPIENNTAFGHTVRIDGSGCEHTLRVNPNKPADDVLIELSNHSAGGLRYVITSLPRFGELRQTSESSNGVIARDENVRKTFETPPTTETEKLVLDWRPFSASSTRKVRRVLNFNNSLHLKQVKIHTSFAPGVNRASSTPNVVATIEACPDAVDCGENSEHGWFVLFKPGATANGLGAPRSNVFSPGFCPTEFKSNRLRIILDPARVDIQAVIDLVEVQGVQSLDMLPFATLLDDRGRLLYERGEKEKAAASSPGAVGKVQFPAVSFGFSILQCSASDLNQGTTVSTGLVVLKFEDSEPVLEPSGSNVVLVSSLAAALVVAAVGIFVQHRRYRAQLAAMRGPSHIGALEFNPHSQLESSVKLLMTLRDDATNDSKRRQLDLCIETLSSSRDVWNVDLNTELENLVDDQQTKDFLLRLNPQNNGARTASFTVNKHGAGRSSELISSSPTNMAQNGMGLATIEDDNDEASGNQRTSSSVGGLNPMFAGGSGRGAGNSPLQNTLASVDSWDFDIHAFARAANQRPVYHMGMELLRHRHGNLLVRFKIEQEKAVAFLDQMDKGYSKFGCAYHCAAHAADVMQGVHHFMQHAAVKRHINVEHVLLTYIAAAMHDYLHPGVNANFLIATNDPLALRYNDERILESMHLAESFALMKRPQFNIFSHWEDTDYRRARSTLIKLVFATDLGQHFNFLGKFKSKIAAAKAPPPASTPHHKPSQQSRSGARMPRMSSAALLSRRSTALRALSPVQQTAFPADAEDTVLLLQMCMKCSDISHPARSWESHCKWSEYFVEENFKQGERERKAGVPISPLCDPNTFNYRKGQVGYVQFIKSQVGFMQFIVEPLYTAFSSFCQESLWDTNLHDNLKRWQAQLADQEPLNGKNSPIDLTSLPPPPMPGSPGNASRWSELPPPPASTPPQSSPPPPPPIMTSVVSSDGRTPVVDASANKTVSTVRMSTSHHQRQHSEV